MATTVSASPTKQPTGEASGGVPASNAAADNLLYYGDNLEVLRLHVADESVDLVYLDPPFNSARNYNVLFAEQSGDRAASQIKVFEDTWRWDESAVITYREVVERGGKVSRAMQAFHSLLDETDMLAYLAMMAPRLVELRRVLKPTGSLYLHCDPTASHYLKMLLDAVFGPTRFRSEIIWKRSSAHSDARQGRRQHGRIHDVLLFYTKTDKWNWHPQYTEYDPGYVEDFYKYVEPLTDRRYRLGDLTGPGGAAKGNPRYEVMGVTRYWRFTKDKMLDLINQGRVIQTHPGAVPAYKRYLDEMHGVPLQDVWTDLRPIGAQAAERLGYPTQKPESLLERIIESSSDEGDTVLDPFCGCGTTVSVAERLKRRWIGIDVTPLAVTLIKHRLLTAFHGAAQYKVIGEPVSLPDAEQLAAQDPYQFQVWALGLVGARPDEGIKRGADKGIDGRLFFHDSQAGGNTKQVIFSVKAGRLQPAFVQQLRGVIEKERAEIGVLITMQAPSKNMRAEAAAADFYESAWGRHPRLQILTVGELLQGARVDYPPSTQVNRTFKKAPQAKPKQAVELRLPLDVPQPKLAPPKPSRLVDQEIAKQVATARVARAPVKVKVASRSRRPNRVRRGA